MAYTYSRLYGLQTVGLRFFTVYGPWGRPDMAPMLFGRSILEDKPIRIFNEGRLSRDFTYIDDIIAGIVTILDHPGLVREDVPGVPAVIYNIGHGSPVQLMDFIGLLEQYLGKPPGKNSSACNPEMCIRPGQTPPNSIPIIITGPPPHSGKESNSLPSGSKK